MKTFKQLKEQLNELQIRTAAGTLKIIKKVPLTTIDGKRIMAYPNAPEDGGRA
jgi:hypothetical protein